MRATEARAKCLLYFAGHHNLVPSVTKNRCHGGPHRQKNGGQSKMTGTINLALCPPPLVSIKEQQGNLWRQKETLFDTLIYANI